jgi:hypothetical protein
MALFGWKTEKMALLYTRKADRKRLATAAGALLERNVDENCRTSGSGATPNEDKAGKSKT